jgi:predicted nucleic acid-binding protein
MRTFIDTGVWFGYLVREDQYHNKAARLMLDLQAKGVLLITSELILSETYTLLMRKLGTKAALQFLEIINKQVESNFTEIAWVDWAILEEAKKVLGKFSDHSITLTDATSAAILRLKGISHIVTFDQHFRIMALHCIP